VSTVSTSRRWAAAGLIVGGALLIASTLTGSTPVLKSSVLLAQAKAMVVIGPSERTREVALDAAKADPWSPEPWQFLSQLDLQRFVSGDAKAFEQFEHDVTQSRRLNRHSQALEVSIGLQYLIAYQRADLKSGLDDSLTALLRAAELYPNSNYVHAQLAWVAHLAGKSGLANEHARLALELNALNPHWEQQLKQRRIEDFAPAADSANQPSPATADAEQIMVWLRNLYDSGGGD
jgi:hypothetical protein